MLLKIGDVLADAPPNVLFIPFGLCRHTDVVASIDLVLSKPGYGIGSELGKADIIDGRKGRRPRS